MLEERGDYIGKHKFDKVEKVEKKLEALFRNKKAREEMQQIVKVYIVFKTEYACNLAIDKFSEGEVFDS